MTRSPTNFWRPLSNRRKMAPKKHIFRTFSSVKQHIVSPTSGRTISVKREHKTLIGEVMITFGTEFRFFPKMGHFLRKTSFWGFNGYTCGARAPAVAVRPTANLSISIAPYSRRTGMLLGGQMAYAKTPYFSVFRFQ